MRLQNFLIQMSFALFVALILVVFVHNIPLAILYVVGHLLWAFFSDRKTIYGEKVKASLEAKFPYTTMPNTNITIDGKTIVLNDSFIKAALLDTICFDDYSSRKKKDKRLLELFYSSVMAGNYQLQQQIISKKGIIPGNDFPDEYYIYCGTERFEIFDYVYKKCEIGNCVVSVKVHGLPIDSIRIWIDPANEHQVAWQNKLYQIGLRFDF